MHYIVDLSQPEIVIGKIEKEAANDKFRLIAKFPYEVGVRQQKKEVEIFLGEECSQLDEGKSQEVVLRNLIKNLKKLDSEADLGQIFVDLFKGMRDKKVSDLSEVTAIIPYEYSFLIRESLEKALADLKIGLLSSYSEIGSLLMFCFEGNGKQSERLKSILAAQKSLVIYIFDYRTEDLRTYKIICVSGSSGANGHTHLIVKDTNAYEGFCLKDKFDEIEKKLKEDALARLDDDIASKHRVIFFLVGKNRPNAVDLTAGIRNLMKKLCPPTDQAVEIKCAEPLEVMELAARGAACLPNARFSFERDNLFGIQLDKERFFPIVPPGASGGFEGRKVFRIDHITHHFNVNLYGGLSDEVASGIWLSRINAKLDEHFHRTEEVDFAVSIKLIHRNRGQITVEIPETGAKLSSIFTVPPII